MRCFLLEDDPVQAAHLVASLAPTSIDVHHFGRAGAFLEALATARPELIVLDWMLPDLSGYQVLLRVRERFGYAAQVVMLTSVDDEAMIVSALEAGADDFLTKPVAAAELRARLLALARRVAPPAATVAKTVVLGACRLDYATQRATVDGDAVTLSPREFDVAWLLLNNPDRFVSKTELIAGVWGRTNDIAAHTIAQHMHAIRKKLRFAAHGIRLVAVYGSGYRLEAPAPAPAPNGDCCAAAAGRAGMAIER